MSAQETKDQNSKETEQVDLRNLQDKFHNLLDHRNQHNDLAREAREARDMLNEQRRKKSQEIEEHKKARDQCNDTMRKHKELRNSYQDQAKALIAERKGKAGGVERSIPLRVRKLRNEIQSLAEKQETTVLGPQKEKELIESIKEKQKELGGLETELEKMRAVEVDITDTDAAIDELFQRADKEHEKVKEHQKRAQGHHEKFVAAIKENRILAAESDDKHQDFIAIRKKADEYHNKAMDLREKVMAVRNEKRAEFQRRKDEIRNLNETANRNVNDPKAIEEAKDEALDSLKKGGKISLGF